MFYFNHAYVADYKRIPSRDALWRAQLLGVEIKSALNQVKSLGARVLMSFQSEVEGVPQSVDAS